MNEKRPENDWWHYEPPPTAYDLVGNNILTNFFRPLLYIAVRIYFKYRHNLIISGYNPLGERQPFIIIANHSSHLDTLLLFSCFPFCKINNIRAVAALDYFFAHTITKVLGHLFCNIIPINRKSADFIAFSMCDRILRSGGSIILFPEGTRTRDGNMGDFKPGLGILIKKTKVSVLPAYIRGTYRCLDYRRTLPRSGPIHVRFGEPISLEESQLRKMNHKEITEYIQQAFVASFQQYIWRKS